MIEVNNDMREGPATRHGTEGCPGSSASFGLRSDEVTSPRLIWCSHRSNDWKILVYKRDESWEACFFCQLHHEHASGHSFESVTQIAEQRIRLLEADRLNDMNCVKSSIN